MEATVDSAEICSDRLIHADQEQAKTGAGRAGPAAGKPTERSFGPLEPREAEEVAQVLACHGFTPRTAVCCIASRVQFFECVQS